MRVGSDHSVKLQLRPAKLPGRPDIPCPLPESQLRLQNDHVLCPANGHSFGHHCEVAFIGAVKFPHPAQVPGRETWNVRVCTAQIFRCGNGGAFLRPFADLTANLAVEFHWCHIRCHQRVQRCEHGTVVYRFPIVHLSFSCPARVRLFSSLPTVKPLSQRTQGLDS